MDPTEERRALAGEFALGLLTGEDAARLDRLRRSDAALEAEFGFWEDRLAGVLAQVAPARPPRGVIERAEKTLFGSAARPPASSAAPFPWKPFLAGLVLFKVTLVLVWYLVNH